jgi:hypothetical protein
MHVKTSVFCFALLVCCAGVGFAQSFGSVDNDKAEIETVIDEGKGFTVQVDIDTNLFQATQTSYSDADQRFHDLNFHRTNSFSIDNYPFGGFNIFNDTNVAFGYNGDWYGGNLSLSSDDGNAKIGGIKAWVSFFDNKLKITAGNDIGYGYADSQGADAGLRVYDDHVCTFADRTNETVDSNRNPDNITQDNSVLFEFNLDPLKIALAGGGSLDGVNKNMGRFISATNDDPIYGYSFRYGVNVGGKIGDHAKINAAYILDADKKVEDTSGKNSVGYRYDPTAGKIIVISADTETWNHLFGLYGSFYP